ncbi:hypothetical protein HWV62_29869 [Athelia sp. TMB]|nr:hypothetical protein HWV62_29869 [Athelia sp. TMB]
MPLSLLPAAVSLTEPSLVALWRIEGIFDVSSDANYVGQVRALEDISVRHHQVHYVLTQVDGASMDDDEAKWYTVLSPRDIVIVKSRDRCDHVARLLERKRYKEALDRVEKIQPTPGDDVKEELAEAGACRVRDDVGAFLDE